MKIDVRKLRALIQEVLDEYDAGSTMSPAARGLLNVGPSGKGTGSKPPPLPGKKDDKPASSSLPQKGALNKFKADVNMAVDAANRVKEHMEAANTKEALRWLDKMIQFASSAKSMLGVK